MNRPRLLLLLLASTVPLLFAACGGKRPPNHYYLLTGSPSREAASTPAGPEGLEIGVAAIHVDPPYDRDSIAYRVGAESPEIGFYAYHHWAAPLTRMLPAVVAEALSGTEGVGAIEPVAPGRTYAAYLSGRVLRLEEVDLPEGQRVRIALSFTLRQRDGTEIWTGSVSGESGLQTERVEDVVEAMRSLLDRLLRDAGAEMGAALGR